MAIDPIVPDLQYGVYLQRRLAQTSRMPQLPASGQFDLARSNVPGRALSDLGPYFGATPRQGWGISDGIDNLIKNDPKTLPVEDLAQFQRNLVQSGYLPPGTIIDGNWSPEFSGAVSQFEQDNREKFYSGYHPGSISIMSAVAQLGNIMPTRVFQGLVGAAKGFIQQSPETVERVGLAGGAVAGAAIGASLGSVLPGPGTVAGGLIGAGVGAITGFFGDLLHHDEDEKNQSFWGQFLDALTPYEEYKGNSKAFFEDLGWVATASSLALGVGTGVNAATAGIAGIGGEVAGGTDVLTATMAKGTVENPGWLTRLASQPVKLLGGEKYTSWVNYAKNYGLKAQWTRPIIKDVTVPLFTGLSEAQMGARLFSGFQAGGNVVMSNWATQFKIAHGRDPTEAERDKFASKHAPTTIEQAIAGAPVPATGLNVPIVGGDLLDLPGWVIYPTGLIPWRAGDWASAITHGLQGTESWMQPFVEATSTLKRVYGAEAHAQTLAGYGENDAERIGVMVSDMLNHGTERMAMDEVVKKGLSTSDPEFWNAVTREKSGIKAKIMAEAGEAPNAAAAEALKRIEAGEKNSSKIDEAMSWNVSDPIGDPRKGPKALEGYLMDMEAKDPGILERGPLHLRANELALQVTTDVREGVRMPQNPVKGGEIKAGKVSAEEASNIDDLGREIKQLQKSIDERTRVAAEETFDSTKASFDLVKVQQDEKRLGEMKDRLAEMKKYKKATWQDKAIVPELLATPTQRDFISWKKELMEVNKKLQQAVLDGNVGQIQVHRQEIAEWATKHADFLKPKDIDRLTRGVNPNIQPITKHLNAHADKAAPDVLFDEATMKKFSDLGYKPVVVPANNIFFTADKRLTEILGMGDYSRRSNMWRSLGLGVDKNSNMSIWKARVGHTKYEVSQWLRNAGKTETSEQVYTRLFDALREKRAGHVLTNETIRAIQPGAEPIITGSGFMKLKGSLPGSIAIDIRDLTPAEVFEATKDWGYSHKEAEGLYHSIKRGHAMGGEFAFGDPIGTAHTLARNFRTSGLPGLGDTLRAWHAENVGTPSKVTPWQAAYTVPDELARSPQVQRVSKELRTAAVKANLTSDQGVILEKTLHDIIQGTVDAGVVPSADEFAAQLKFGWAEEFIADGQSYLFKKMWEGASFDHLDEMVNRYHNSGEFSDYSASRDAITDTFGGQWTTLDNGDVIPVDHLMMQLIAATSPGALPVSNMTFAMKAMTQHVTGEVIEGVGRYGKQTDEIVADILRGHTMNKWSPELRAAREKTHPFFRALYGDPDALVIDRRIKIIHGLGADANITPEVRAGIEDQYRLLADKYDIPVSSVQASVWVGFQDYMKEQAGILRRQGDTSTAKKLEAFVTDAAKDNRGYNDVLANPTKAQKEYLDVIMRYTDQVPQEVHFKRLEDNILGATTFGQDYSAHMQVFKTGDFNTFTHEFGHLLFRSLPHDQVAEIERMFGVRKPLTEVQGAWRKATGEEFVAAREAVSAERKHFLSPYGAEDIPNIGNAYLSPDGKVGFILKNDGEIANVFNVSGRPGAGTEAVRAGIAAGGDRVEYFEGKLGQIYGREGFLESERFPFDYDLIRQDFPDYSVHAAGMPDYVVAHRWSPEASEKFSNEFENYMKTKVADTQRKARLFEALRRKTGNSWLGYRGFVEDKNTVHPELRRLWDGYFGDLSSGTKSAPMQGIWRPGTRALAGATAGASLGLVYGKDSNFDDIVRGAAMGAVGGVALNFLLKRSYGYLPDYLLQVGSALRFSLNPSFDARRFTKGQLLAMMNKEELPFMGNSRRALQVREWPSLENPGTMVTGEAAQREALHNWMEINGKAGYLEDMDTFERTLSANGILGYNPRQREITYSYLLATKKRSPEQIRKTMSEVFSYGFGRTNLEKTVNFIFFPFSFEKKLLTTVGDFLFQAPGRALLLHEGLRRYQQSKWDTKISDFLDRHVPILQELESFNAFAHGLSPGRFVLEGMFDHRTGAAAATQVLSTFFLAPGGAALTPFAQQLGGWGDLSVHAFTPVAITGQQIMEKGGDLQTGTGVDQILRNFTGDYIPFVTDLHELFTSVHDQAKALTEGEAPWSQLRDYLDENDKAKAMYTDIARLTGHPDSDAFFQSDEGQWAYQAYQQRREELRTKYPTGFQMSTGFEDSQQLADHALYDVNQKVASGNYDRAEEVISQISAMQKQADILGQTMTTVDPQVMKDSTARSIRGYALKYVGDSHFVELWNQLFAWKYGPLTVVV